MVFVAISYNRDHEMEVVGIAATRAEALRMVELERNEMLRFSDYGVDGPDGSAAIDNAGGDMIGYALACEIGKTWKETRDFAKTADAESTETND